MRTQLADFIKDTPAGREADAILRKCVHCGFCTATCPTYQLWGEEMDSPRGRIWLMKATVDGTLELDRTVSERFDRCLGCMACLTSCPSGVQYGSLIEQTRGVIEERHDRVPVEDARRSLLLALLTTILLLITIFVTVWIFGIIDTKQTIQAVLASVRACSAGYLS